MAFREPFWAIAVKIQDGADRALPPICLSILEQLAVFAEERPQSELSPLYRPLIKNHRQLLTGEVVATLQLTRR
jgi:L-asparaginase II